MATIAAPVGRAVNSLFRSRPHLEDLCHSKVVTLLNSDSDGLSDAEETGYDTDSNNPDPDGIEWQVLNILATNSTE